jgi:hypothetical protein
LRALLPYQARAGTGLPVTRDPLMHSVQLTCDDIHDHALNDPSPITQVPLQY